MSLRIAPSANHPVSANNTQTSSSKGAPSAPGLHDTLRSNLSLHDVGVEETPVQSAHPLETRLANWQATQDRLKMNLLRRNFGIAEPIRREMEMKICRDGEWRPAALGGSANVGGDVLSGRDGEITWEDVYRGNETREAADFHTEMESRMKMDS